MRRLLLLLVILGSLVPGTVRAGLIKAQVDAVGFDEHPGAALPLDETLRDETGATRRLGTLIGDEPAVLLFADYTCQSMCGVAVETLAQSLSGLSLRPGSDFTVLIVGLDPKDTPADAAAMKAAHFGRAPAPGVHFLSGNAATIKRLTGAVGVNYSYDAEHDQFAHPVGLTLITADGRIGRYLVDLGFTTQDLRLALVETGQGSIGTITDHIRLLCYAFDPLTGVYTPIISRILSIAAIVTVLAIALLFLLLMRLERRRARAHG